MITDPVHARDRFVDRLTALLGRPKRLTGNLCRLGGAFGHIADLRGHAQHRFAGLANLTGLLLSRLLQATRNCRRAGRCIGHQFGSDVVASDQTALR